MTALNGRDQSLKLLGEMSITFAGIEHSITVLLSHLVGGDVLVQPLLIDRMPLSQAIRICKQAGDHFFENDPDQLDKLKSLLKRIDARRVERNQFVHGQWTIDEAGYVSITTFKLKMAEKKTHWEYLHTQRMTPSKLHQHAKEVAVLWDELCEFVNTLLGND